MIGDWNEDHKNVRLNYAKANFDESRKFFKGVQWNGLMEGKTAQEKYEIF